MGLRARPSSFLSSGALLGNGASPALSPPTKLAVHIQAQDGHRVTLLSEAPADLLGRDLSEPIGPGRAPCRLVSNFKVSAAPGD